MFLLLVFNGRDKYCSCVDLSTEINICSSILGLAMKVFYSESLLDKSIDLVWKMSIVFRYCCSFCNLPFLYSSSIRLPASVRVSACPVSFNRDKTSSPSQLPVLVEGIIFLIIST